MDQSTTSDRWDHTAHSHSQRKNFNNNHWSHAKKTRSLYLIFLCCLCIPVQSNQSKHPWPTNQLQGAMSTHIRLSKHTNIMGQDFGGKNEPLPRVFDEKNRGRSAARVRRVSVGGAPKDVTRRGLSHWKLAFPKHPSQMLRLTETVHLKKSSVLPVVSHMSALR